MLLNFSYPAKNIRRGGKSDVNHASRINFISYSSLLNFSYLSNVMSENGCPVRN